MVSSETRRLERFRALLASTHRRIGLEFGFRLWDGSFVPAGWPASGLAVALADEGVVASLMRSPKITTLANLWVAKRIDLLNGSIFDLVARRPKMRTRELRKAIDKRQALGAAAAFLLTPRGGPWPLEAIAGDKPSDGSQAENKKNISYHYDISNPFYQLFLDREMVYSCAYFHAWSDDLDTAQFHKLDMTCRRLRLKPGETMLDIGCGWGALICHAALHYGVKAHGVTLSEKQFVYAKEKIERLGLHDRVVVELKDYALVEGRERFDKIASIGMAEHVGIKNLPTYYGTAHRLLKPGGLFLNHAITRPGSSHAVRAGRKRPEFKAIARFVFPGAELEYIGRTVSQLEFSGFEIRDVEGWREHYQRTCRLWHDRLAANYDAACKEAGETTTRLWLAYIGACSIVFERGDCGVYQTLALKRVKGPSGLPPTRADLYQ